jgi:hypothetical protein
MIPAKSIARNRTFNFNFLFERPGPRVNRAAIKHHARLFAAQP